MEIAIVLGIIALAAILGKRTAAKMPPPGVPDPEPSPGPVGGDDVQTVCPVCHRTLIHKGNPLDVPPHQPCPFSGDRNAYVPDAEIDTFERDNARELQEIDRIEAMLGEQTTVVMDPVVVRADGNGVGSVSNPTAVPVKGSYYRVKTGDNPSHVMTRAGYDPSKWRKLSAANSWCEKRDSSGKLVGMQFYKRWDPPGFNTTLRSTTAPELVFPIIYIPRAEEVGI